jgi:PAS domain S-box-containing protein
MVDEVEGRLDRERHGEEPSRSDLNMMEKILEHLPIAIIIQDADGRNIYANARAEQILGMGRREITARRYDSEEWDPRDRDGNPKKRKIWVAERIRATGKPVFDEEIVVPRPNGSQVTILVNAAPIRGEDDSYGGLVYAFDDITQRVRAEKELAAHREHFRELVDAKTAELRESNRMLRARIEECALKEKELQITAEQLRSLSQRTETVREGERAQFAARIHDTFEQSLAILKMQVKELERKLSDRAAMEGELDRIYATLDHFLDEIQGVTDDLHPRILNDAGLVAAMEWRTSDIGENMGIDTSFNSDLKGVIISDVLSTFVYRVFQEAAENAARHSETMIIRTGLSLEEGMLTLRISEEGRETSQHELGGPSSLEVLWMKERARHFGGSVDIVELPDKGTEVILRVPVSSI